MTTTDPRPLLPLTVRDDSAHVGGRSSITCLYRCGSACDHAVPNNSDNAYFGDVVKSAMSRRGLLKAGAVAVVAVGGAGMLSGTAAAAPVAPPTGRGASGSREPRSPQGTAFGPVDPNTLDAVVVPAGYLQQVVVRWGDPIVTGAPSFDFDNQTEAAQLGQFGYNNDFVGLVPVPGVNGQFFMVVNHEYTTESAMFRGYDPANPTDEQIRIGLAAHGMSVLVVNAQRRSGALNPVADSRNRRVHSGTEFRVTGPAAGSAFLQTAADPTGTAVLGTFNNCAGGVTPWGTVLSGEENFNQYFANAETVTDPVAARRLARYGIGGGASQRKWERLEPRFDLALEPNEVNRHGYIVEIDPSDPASVPVKHSALGRFKHEGATVHLTRGNRVVAYMGDDERFDYMYKFVADGKMRNGNGRRAKAENMTLLDSGTLYVAQLRGDSPALELTGGGGLPSDGQFDGTGQWLPLLHTDADGSGTSFVNGFSAEEVAVFTREAADAVGATKMDRPEDMEANPVTGKVYVALTNNSNRGVGANPGPDEANPRRANRNGQVLELVESRGNHAGTAFTWNLLLVCGDPAAADTYYGGFPKDQVSPISCPDNVAFDEHGNLWVSTDGNALGSNDGLFSVATEGRDRGLTKQFLTVPIGAETCGPIISRDRVVVAVQHPGEVSGSSADAPMSSFPDGPGTQPRPSVVAVWQRNGRAIGR